MIKQILFDYMTHVLLESVNEYVEPGPAHTNATLDHSVPPLVFHPAYVGCETVYLICVLIEFTSLTFFWYEQFI